MKKKITNEHNNMTKLIYDENGYVLLFACDIKILEVLLIKRSMNV